MIIGKSLENQMLDHSEKQEKKKKTRDSICLFFTRLLASVSCHARITTEL